MLTLLRLPLSPGDEASFAVDEESERSGSAFCDGLRLKERLSAALRGDVP
jgi:hypothetical protein